MKIIIENQPFSFDIGCKLLKLKYEECPFDGYIKEIWDSIIPATFQEISIMPNLEQRRVGIVCLGIEKLIKQVNPDLVDKKTIKKTTNWVNEKGEVETVEYNDTYELYTVKGEHLGKMESWRRYQDVQYVKCKDTSTQRDYMIWINNASVFSTNYPEKHLDFSKLQKITAIQAVAWTIQTNVPEGNIEKIIRQGDCILIKPKGKFSPCLARHLTGKEYKELLILES